MVDGHPRFDQVPAGYHGPIYALVTPKSWPVKVRAGDSLTQLRLFEGDHRSLETAELQALHADAGLIFDPIGERIASTESLNDNAVILTVDLEGSTAAYQAKHAIALIDLRKIKAYAADDFFTPIARPKDGELVLKEGEFYILPSFEYVRVPLDYAAEMAAYDVAAGEFRSHYAGFFDPGWGCTEGGGGTGAPIVLEVLPHETVILRHRQPISRAVYERLTEPSDRPYGVGVTSNYHGQRGPRLSKHFK
jgi:dCTP deaminase